MIELKGGYQIIDLKNVSLTGTPQDIDSTLRGKILNAGKPCLVINLAIGDTIITPFFTSFFYTVNDGTIFSDVIYVQGYGSRRFACDTDGKFRVISVLDLPAVSSADNGKALVVKSGTWSKEDIATLPTVTASDNGKILKVVNGAWVVVTPE